MLPRADVEAGRAAALVALAREQPHLFAPGQEKTTGTKRNNRSSPLKPGSGGGNDGEEGDRDRDRDRDRDGDGDGDGKVEGDKTGSGDDGLLAPGATNLGLLSRQHIAALPAVRAVVESNELFDLAEALLECAAAEDEEGGQKERKEEEAAEGEEEEEVNQNTSGVEGEARSSSSSGGLPPSSPSSSSGGAEGAQQILCGQTVSGRGTPRICIEFKVQGSGFRV